VLLIEGEREDAALERSEMERADREEDKHEISAGKAEARTPSPPARNFPHREALTGIHNGKYSGLHHLSDSNECVSKGCCRQ
jgi:hypothetical protein